MVIVHVNFGLPVENEYDVTRFMKVAVNRSSGSLLAASAQLFPSQNKPKRVIRPRFILKATIYGTRRSTFDLHLLFIHLSGLLE